MLGLELLSGLDALVGGCELDQNAVLVDSDRLVESNEFPGLLDVAFLVERQGGVNLGGDTARDDREDLLAELDELYTASASQFRTRSHPRTRRSMAASTWTSMSEDCSLAYLMATSMTREL